MPRFPRTAPKRAKQERGATAVAKTPIDIRTKLSLTARFEDHVRARLAARIGYAAALIERGTVRFDDVNGPRGGIDTVCRIELIVSGMPSVRVQVRGKGPEDTFNQALATLANALERAKGKYKRKIQQLAAAPAAAAPARAAVAPEPPGDGEVIGRRRGRGANGKARSLARPEKARRDAYVDTSAPGKSETDRKAGGGITARRNSMAKPSRATAALEDSRTRPSRKSTRRSANRGKPSQRKERAAVAKSLRPGAKAKRAQVARGRR